MTDSGDERDTQGDEARAARRLEFIRTHHPDRGGDPESFIEGLRRFDEQRPTGNADRDPGPPPRVVLIRRQAWPSRLIKAAVRRLRHDNPPPRVR